MLLVDNLAVPPIVDDDHVLAVVVVGLELAIWQVHDDTAVGSHGALASEVAMVEVRAGLHVVIHQEF